MSAPGGHATDRRSIRAVICDAGGVLLHPDFDWIVAQAAGLGLELVREHLHLAYYAVIHQVDLDPSMQRRGMAVDSDAVRRYLMTHLLRQVGVPRDQVGRVAEQLATAATGSFPRESDIYRFAMPGVRAQVERLRRAGFALAVASNNDGALDSQLEQVGLTDLFPVRLDSAVEGVAKPDPQLLLRAADRLGVSPIECVYVGDIDRVDGAAARSAGMYFALLDPLGLPRPSRPLSITSLDRLQEHFRLAG